MTYTTYNFTKLNPNALSGRGLSEAIPHPLTVNSQILLLLTPVDWLSL